MILVSTLVGQTLSIQGVLRDDTGTSVADGLKNFTFQLYAVSEGGSSVWNETQQIEVVNGVYNALLGSVNSLDGLDYNINYWLGISVEDAEEMAPRTQLALSPYAIASVSGVDNVFPQSGNVGIGTTTPTQALEVIGNSNFAGHLYIGSAQQIEGLGRLHITGSELLYLLNKDGVIVSKSWDGNGQLKVEGDLFASSNVGIGTTDPRSKLMVHDGAAYISKSISYSHTGTYTYLLMGMNQHQSDASYNTKFLFDIEATPATQQSKMHLRAGRVDWSADEFSIPDASHKTEIMTFDGGGNVGIGTTSPGAKLDVNGNIRFDGTHLIYNSKDAVIDWGANNEGTLYFRKLSSQGDPGSYTQLAHINKDGGFFAIGGCHTWSDIRLKSNVVNITNGLMKALQLKPVEFEMKNRLGIPRIGFVANDVQQVVPEAVTEAEDGLLAIEYGALSAVAIAAIQDQQKIIETQQSEIDNLKERLTQLEASLRK